MTDRDDYTVRLVDDLPASVGGFVTESPDGHLNIYINARHGWNGQRRSLRHELRHADADDLRSTDPLAVIEARADQKPSPLGKVARPQAVTDEVPAAAVSPPLPSPSRAREACAVPCLKEGGSAPALSDEVPARLASIPHLMRARDLLPPPCLPLQGKVAERSEVGRGRPLPSLTPRQLAVIHRALAELDNFCLRPDYNY